MLPVHTVPAGFDYGRSSRPPRNTMLPVHTPGDFAFLPTFVVAARNN